MLLIRLGNSYRDGRFKINVGYGMYLDEYLNFYIPDGSRSYDEDDVLYRVGDLYISRDEDAHNRIYRVGDLYISYDDDEGGRAYRVGDTYISYDDDEGGRPYRIGDVYLGYDEDGRLCRVGDKYF